MTVIAVIGLILVCAIMLGNWQYKNDLWPFELEADRRPTTQPERTPLKSINERLLSSIQRAWDIMPVPNLDLPRDEDLVRNRRDGPEIWTGGHGMKKGGG